MNKTSIGEEWWTILESSFNEVPQLKEFVVKEYKNPDKVIYPQPNDLFKAFKLCKPTEVKVVIIGQD